MKFSFSKKFSLISFAFILLLFVGCTESSVSDSGEQEVQVANPLQSVESADEFANQLGISIDAPNGASEVEYIIISGDTAQIEFSLDGFRYTLRASKLHSDEALHGVYETFDDAVFGQEVDGDDFTFSIDVMSQDNGKGVLSTATVNFVNSDNLYISLYTDSDLEPENMMSTITEICNDIVG